MTGLTTKTDFPEDNSLLSINMDHTFITEILFQLLYPKIQYLPLKLEAGRSEIEEHLQLPSKHEA